jgi:hypothetical protein
MGETAGDTHGWGIPSGTSVASPHSHGEGGEQRTASPPNDSKSQRGLLLNYLDYHGYTAASAA